MWIAYYLIVLGNVDELFLTVFQSPYNNFNYDVVIYIKNSQTNIINTEVNFIEKVDNIKALFSSITVDPIDTLSKNILNMNNITKNMKKYLKLKIPSIRKYLIVKREYSNSIMQYLRYEVKKRKMKFGFPLLHNKKLYPTKSKKDMVTLLDFIN